MKFSASDAVQKSCKKADMTKVEVSNAPTLRGLRESNILIELFGQFKVYSRYKCLDFYCAKIWQNALLC